MSQFRKWEVSDRRVDTSPNPDNFQVVEHIQGTDFHMVIAKYPDATNFEGTKVMVYKGQYKDIAARDPHFYEGDESPIARFKPDPEGIGMAISLVLGL